MTDKPPKLGDEFWRVQPRWMKVLICVVGLPAWLVWTAAVLGFISFGEHLMFAFWVFAAVSLLSSIFVARAFWRMDL